MLVMCVHMYVYIYIYRYICMRTYIERERDGKDADHYVLLVQRERRSDAQ